MHNIGYACINTQLSNSKPRITTFTLSFVTMIILKVVFDVLYSYLITSNIIQRNILLVGDSFNCKDILKNFGISIFIEKDYNVIKEDSDFLSKYFHILHALKLFQVQANKDDIICVMDDLELQNELIILGGNFLRIQ